MPLTPIQSLISKLARFDVSDLNQEELRREISLSGGHENLLGLIRFHRLAIHIDRNLSGLKSHGFARADRLAIAREAIYAQKMFEQQWRRLTDINAAFGLADIDLMLIKGPAVSQRLYGQADRRVLYDIDIMVRPDDLERAILTLRSIGYETDLKFLRQNFTATDLLRLQKWGSNIGFVHQDDPDVLIELHWRPGRYDFEFPFSTDEIWTNAQKTQIKEQTLYQMGPNQEAIFLCVHGFKHEWKRWHWLLDIDQLLRLYGDDFTHIISLAKEKRLEKIVYQSIWMAHLIFQSPLHPEWRSAIKGDPSIDQNCRSIINRRYKDDPQNDTAKTEAIMEWQNAGFRNGLRGRGQLLRAHLSPGPHEWQWIRLPAFLSALYYPLRILRIKLAIIKSLFR